MRQMETFRKQSTLGGTDTCTLVYFVTVDELTDSGSGIQLEAYGVGVTICERRETAYIRNVTFSKSDVLRLSRLLAENLVTPVTVGDVVEDWLDAV